MFCCSYIINKFCSKNARVVFNVAVFWGSTNVRYTMDYIFLLRYLNFEENLQGKKTHPDTVPRNRAKFWRKSMNILNE